MKIKKKQITYVIESQGYHKIGIATSWEERKKSYYTHNPKFEVIYLIEGDLEKMLHKKFQDKRTSGEWFLLDNTDLEFLNTLPKSNPDELREIEKQNKEVDLVVSKLFAGGNMAEGCHIMLSEFSIKKKFSFLKEKSDYLVKNLLDAGILERTNIQDLYMTKGISPDKVKELYKPFHLN